IILDVMTDTPLNTSLPAGKRRYLKWIAGVLVVLALAGGLLWYYFPYQQAATRQLRQALEARGLKVASLELEHFTTDQATLSHIALGATQQLTIANMTVDYRHSEAMKGKVRTVAVEKLQAALYRQDGKWQIGGLEPLLEDSEQSAPLNPVQQQDLAQLLP